MTTTIYMDSREYADTQQLVKSAIDGEVARLELALALARQRLAPFEEKYGVTNVAKQKSNRKAQREPAVIV